MADGVLPTPEAWRQLRRELAELRHRVRNHDHQITQSVQGHRASAGLHDRRPVLVTNQTSGTLDRGSVLEFSESSPRAVPLEGLLWFHGVEPTKDNPPAWGVTTRKIADGSHCVAHVAGHTQALVNVTDTAHEFARVESGQTVLTSCLGRGDVRILDNPGGGTGTKLCPVNILPKFRAFRGVTAEEIEGSSSGDVLLTEPNKTEEVYNPFASTIGDEEPVVVFEVDGQLTMVYPGEGTTGGAPSRIGVRFVLSEDMSATTAGEASAEVLTSWGDGAPANATPIVVRDPGVGSPYNFEDSRVGSVGIAWNIGTPSEPDYLIHQCSRVSRKFQVRCTTSFCATDTGDVSGSLDLANLTWLDFGPFVEHVPSANIVVTNPGGNAATKPDTSDPDGDWVWCERLTNDKAAGKWQFQIYKVQKHAVIVPTHFRIFNDEGTWKVQFRGVKAAIEYCEHDLDDWHDMLPASEDCP